MTDLSHPTQLPTITRHIDDLLCVSRTWIEPKCKTGETPDLFSVVERAVVDIAPDFSLYPGQTVVGEFKSSVADLKADAAKPWRDPQCRALGDYRIAWLHTAGPVRPEHVDDSTGWGVVMYDEQQAEIVRKPQLYHNVNTWAQTALIVKLMSKEARRGQGRPRGSVRAAKHLAEAIKLLEVGPLTTGQLRALLNYPGTSQKLAAELRRCDKVSQDGAGGNWRLA